MNIYAIKKKIRSGDMSKDTLKYLIECECECEWLDYKVRLNLDTAKELCNFAKDALAMRNTGGGYFVIGIKDKTWEPVGLTERIEYDGKMLRDKMNKATNATVDIDIVHHHIHYSASTGLFALILIRSSINSSKSRKPTIAQKDYCPREKYGLRQGYIYVRKGDSTVRIKTQDEINELLDRLEALCQEDEYASYYKQSYFAVEDGLFRLLDRGYDQFIGRSGLRKTLLESIFRDPRIWIVNIHGPGGVGKSSLANWVVYELYKNNNGLDGIIHLSAKDKMLQTSGIFQCTPSLWSLDNLLDHVLKVFEETIPADLPGKKELVLEYLTVFKMLLVLDNMETVEDGRILDFVRNLPPESNSKVLLTSRQKTGYWELPIYVKELSKNETREFIQTRCREEGLSYDDLYRFVDDIWKCTGGLPLALQWFLGRYKMTKEIKKTIDLFKDKDCPVLEYSFRNVWNVLSQDAKKILAALTVFDDYPTTEMVSIVTSFPIDRVEKALTDLEEVTLVNKFTKKSDGKIAYATLPITLSFAKNELAMMGQIGTQWRQQYHDYLAQIELEEVEISSYKDTFTTYEIKDDNEKKAVTLCIRAQTEHMMSRTDSADSLFQQAVDLTPQSSYINTLRASYELNRNNLEAAQIFINEAKKRLHNHNKLTASFCYTIMAKIYEVKKEWSKRLTCLQKASEYDLDNDIILHQYGVALSLDGQFQEAIKKFDIIIEKEIRKLTPSKQLMLAIKTRMLNYQKLGETEKLNRDIDTVTKLFDSHPHLSNEIEHFREFLDSNSCDNV